MFKSEHLADVCESTTLVGPALGPSVPVLSAGIPRRRLRSTVQRNQLVETRHSPKSQYLPKKENWVSNFTN
jgi:hypothetical protein